MPKEKKEQKEDLQDVVSEIKQRFGEGAIMRLKEIRPVNVDVISTGSLAMDAALGVGGIPRGRVVEIFGSEGSGKTTLALHVLAEAQRMGGQGAFVDAEHALDPDYSKKIGVNVEELLISQPSSGEEALEIVESLVRSGEIDVIVVDSVAALTPKAEIVGDMGEFQIGLQARMMSQALRKLAGIISKTKTSVIFLNQTRMKIGVRFGDPTTTPGGLALKFYASVRVNLSRIAKIKQGDEIVGSRIVAKVVKNKVAAPFRNAEFDIYYNEGISKTADILNFGLKRGVINRSGSYFKYNDNMLGQGVESAREFLKGNPKILSEIKKAISKS